jgi:hypothetical protein
MSGTLIPSVSNLGKEIIPTIISSNTMYAGAPGLWDGKAGNTGVSTYWYSSSHYIEIDIPNICNIYRLGYNGNKAPLTILKYNGTSYDDVTSLYPQTLEVTSALWEKTISKLPAGRYKFQGGNGLRVDNEWYLEETNNNKYLIKNADEKIYTYDAESNEIIESPSQTIDMDNFNNNGFNDPTIITEEIWGNVFPDKMGLQLLIYTDDTTKTQATIEYNVPEYRPIDKLNDQFQIKKYIPGATIPDTPTNLTASDITQNSAVLTWE